MSQSWVEGRRLYAEFHPPDFIVLPGIFLSLAPWAGIFSLLCAPRIYGVFSVWRVWVRAVWVELIILIFLLAAFLPRVTDTLPFFVGVSLSCTFGY